jgi:hypothetical protein
MVHPRLGKCIVIIGNAGSGKSYLASALAAQHSLPVINLDDLFWLDGSYQTKRPADDVFAPSTASASRTAGSWRASTAIWRTRSSLVPNCWCGWVAVGGLHEGPRRSGVRPSSDPHARN